MSVHWWRGRPATRFGPLLLVFGIVSWQGARAPLAFDLEVLAEVRCFVLTFYLFLAFPWAASSRPPRAG